ncbi:MAG: DUF2961 domain-containing protein [Planctomycetes bacterium]|nr:DUF2961 domain-containing protein [Planctomycetota bacterium]
MVRSSLVIAAAAALSATAALAQDAPVARIGFAGLLERTADLDRLFVAPRPGERCVQFSSYDRRSHAGPEDAEAWYANADRGQYLRVEDRDGRREYVMVDAEGPAFVARIWSANPSGTLRFYVDGEAEPRWTVDFAALLSGQVEALPEPVCGVRSRGANCHLPIPFDRRLVLTCDTGDFYYQVNVQHLAAGEHVFSFRPEWLREQRAAIDRWAAALAGGPRAIEAASGPGAPVLQTEAVAPDADGAVWTRFLEGPGVIRGLWLGLAGPAARPALARQARLCIDVDEEAVVDVPLGDFFASAPGLDPWAGRALGVLPDGTGYCLFPMPFVRGIRLRVLLDGPAAEDDGLQLTTAIWNEPATFDEAPLTFRAAWHQVRDLHTRPRGDHLVVDARGGPGRFVGCGLVVRNPTRAWWGEGDERIVVDGEDFPSTFGTGTEDYFGYAWCCPEPFSSPLHAQPHCDGPGNFGYTQNVRLQLHDAVPFHRSLRFDLEVWHWKDVEVDYASTVWFYGATGVTSGLPAVPPAAERALVEMVPPVAFLAEGAVEGEQMRVVECTGGTHTTQDMSGFEGARWSRDGQLWWMDGKVGDRLIVAVPVQRPGRYRVQAVFTTARDYARIRVLHDGRPLGDVIDLYSPEVSHTGVVELGKLAVDGHATELAIEIAGHDERAIPRHMVGIDYVRLVAD